MNELNYERVFNVLVKETSAYLRNNNLRAMVLGISNSDLDQIGAKSYYDVDRVLQTVTCKASPENDKLQDELIVELGPDVVDKIIQRHRNSRFKRLLSPIIVPRELYD